MGGALASLYAMKYAGRINKVVLISPGITISSGYIVKHALQHNLVQTLFIQAGKQTLKARMRNHFHQPDNFSDYYDKATRQTGREGFWRSLISTIVNYPEDLLSVLHYYPEGSPRPLIVWGEDDAITAFSDCAQVVEALGAALFSLADASHAVHYEYPDIVNARIVDYLG